MVRPIVFILSIILSVLAENAQAQSLVAPKVPLFYNVIESPTDTIYMYTLKEVVVVARPRFKSRRQEYLYTRLVRDVKITLPYAQKAALVLSLVNDTLQSMKNEKQKKEYLKNTEKTLFAEFEQPLRRMTFSQGRLLIKLIDRECQQNSYELVRLYRGGFSAFFWQGIAKIFGANLKSEYDAQGEDREVERIIGLIQSGYL
jgi:hypothetical protein